jgi:hypothetical protein
MSEPRFLYHTFKNMQVPLDPTKAIQGDFYHGISHGSYYGLYAEEMIKRNLNRGAPGMLASPNYVAYLEPNYSACHISIRDQEIEELRRKGQNRGGLTPRAIEHLNKISDSIELEFEEARRRISPESASRIDCLYVADNRETIRRMFPDDSNLIIFKVNIVEALRFTKADSKWFEKYRVEKNLQNIENYWLSKLYDNGGNNWEYLVDGLIMLNDPEGLETLCELWSEKDFDG